MDGARSRGPFHFHLSCITCTRMSTSGSESRLERTLLIGGAHGERGGQILRTTASLASAPGVSPLLDGT